jgi:prolipoprotein diacylglyceryltransferase
VFGGIYMVTPDDGAGYFVPTQLYEALFLFALTVVLTILCVKRYQITMHIYLIAYGIWRIFIEFFRADERGAFVLGLAPSQWQSILFIVAGVILFIFYIHKKWKFVAPEELPEEQPVLEENKDDIEEV